MKKIKTPLSKDDARRLKCGDTVLLSGIIYTARDAAHALLVKAINGGEKLPFELENAIVYYVGPTPSMSGKVIGSAGPTTSGRMDKYTPKLIEHGITGMIGKGARNDNVVAAMREYGAVYFGAVGGTGALLAKCVEVSEIVAYEELGAEAVRKLTVKDMPLTVIIDSEGNDLYEQGRRDYLRSVAGTIGK